MNRVRQERAESLEEHYMEAYLRIAERCYEFDYHLPSYRTSTVFYPLLGVTRRRHLAFAGHVLEWLDALWPQEMRPSKVPEKLAEHVEDFRGGLFGGAGIKVRQTIFFGFRRPSPRIADALPFLGERFADEVVVLEGDALIRATERILLDDAEEVWKEDNWFLKAARILEGAGWGPDRGPGDMRGRG